MNTVTNFARFYKLFNRLPCDGDRDEMKRGIVMQYTDGRTDSLREMTGTEYTTCCNALERLTGYNDELKKRRSQCLRLMQKLGIDTTDWARINAFCEDRRIAGAPFARLTNQQLEALAVKLRAIYRRGGLRARQDTDTPPHPDDTLLCIIPPTDIIN